MDVSQQKFKKYMRQGLGRVFDIFDNATNLNVYKDAVLYGCLNNIAYDLQCEGSRAYYVFLLTEYFHDDAFFESKILEKLAKKVHYGTFVHLVDMLVLFWKKKESTKSQNLLESVYHQLFTKQRYSKWDREKFDYICLVMSQTGGIRKTKKILMDIDSLYKKQLNSRPSFDWFFFHVTQHFPDFAAFIQKNCKNIDLKHVEGHVTDEEEKAEKERYLHVDYILDRIKNGNYERYKTLQFCLKARTEEKEKMIKTLLSEKDGVTKKTLLEIIRHGDFPVTFSELKEMWLESSKDEKALVLEAIINLDDKNIRQFGYSLLGQLEYRWASLSMIAKYYDPDDYDVLMELIPTVKISYDRSTQWHSFFSTVMEIFDKNVKNKPVPLLKYMYENTLCSECREYILRRMQREHSITKDIIDECSKDVNYEIQKYVRRIKPKKEG